jgi:hypothetical protein
LRFVEGGSVEVVSGTVGFLRGLAEEFYCDSLELEWDKFYRRPGLLEFSIVERLCKLGEGQCVVERRLSAADVKLFFFVSGMEFWSGRLIVFREVFCQPSQAYRFNHDFLRVKSFIVECVTISLARTILVIVVRN